MSEQPPEARAGIGGFCGLCGNTNPDDLGKVIGICLDATACHQRQYARLRDRADVATARAETAETALEHAKAALAGDHEGVRLWMLDCGELVAKHRDRAEAAEAKLAEVRKELTMSLVDTGDELGVLERPADDSAMLDRALRLIGRLLAITGSDEEPRDA